VGSSPSSRNLYYGFRTDRSYSLIFFNALYFFMTSAIFLAPAKIIGAGLATFGLAGAGAGIGTFSTCIDGPEKQNPCNGQGIDKKQEVVVHANKTVVSVDSSHLHIHKHADGFITHTTTTTTCSFDFLHSDFS
jgi:hypothetical protein